MLISKYNSITDIYAQATFRGRLHDCLDNSDQTTGLRENIFAVWLQLKDHEPSGRYGGISTQPISFEE